MNRTDGMVTANTGLAASSRESFVDWSELKENFTESRREFWASCTCSGVCANMSVTPIQIPITVATTMGSGSGIVVSKSKTPSFGRTTIEVTSHQQRPWS